jgi:hypothetical protein
MTTAPRGGSQTPVERHSAIESSAVIVPMLSLAADSEVDRDVAEVRDVDRDALLATNRAAQRLG